LRRARKEPFGKHDGRPLDEFLEDHGLAAAREMGSLTCRPRRRSGPTTPGGDGGGPHDAQVADRRPDRLDHDTYWSGRYTTSAKRTPTQRGDRHKGRVRQGRSPLGPRPLPGEWNSSTKPAKARIISVVSTRYLCPSPWAEHPAGLFRNALWCAEAGPTGRLKKRPEGAGASPARTFTLSIETGKGPEPTPGFHGRFSGRRAC
jgi:hypothetical protein